MPITKVLKICLWVLFSILAPLWNPASRAANATLSIDTQHSYAVESGHFAHVTLIVPVDWPAVPRRARPQILSQIRGELRQRSCTMLRASGREFGYVKTGNGYLEVDLRDAHGRVITVSRAGWVSCR